MLFPYLNGDDLNSRPDCSPSRWVVDFFDRPLDVARRYGIPFARVLEQVKPEREKVNRKVHRERVWAEFTARPQDHESQCAGYF